MPYSALLTGHLVAVTLFLAGLFTAGALIPGLSVANTRSAIRRQELRRVRGMALLVTTPALIGVWGFGTAMALQAGWFASGWLKAKLLLVLMLSAWHGRQLSTLRRLAAARPVPAGRLGSLGLAAIVVAGIVTLVVEKPF